MREDFPEKKYDTPQAKENEVVFRYHPQDNSLWECIPFWELTSFLHFLATPGLDGHFSPGLYNIVGQTLLSPYMWDPFGIQNRIVPIMDTIFVREYKIASQVDEIGKKIHSLNDNELIAKDYLDMIYSALIIEYCLNCNRNPPCHISSLLGLSVHRELYDRVNAIIRDARNRSYDYSGKSGSGGMHDAHYAVLTRQDDYITRYIQKMYREGIKTAVREEFLTQERKEKIQSAITVMYRIIDDEMQIVPMKGIF